MPMKLTGSCQCGGIEFTLQSSTPVPYQFCVCSICRKCCGSGGTINLGGIASSLEITKGRDLIKKYKAIKDRGTPSEKRCTSERSFCSTCASMLWLWDATWPELIHPFASAIDTELPVVPEEVEMVCVMGGSKKAWVRWPEGKKSIHDKYGGHSIDEWHKKNGLFVE